MRSAEEKIKRKSYQCSYYCSNSTCVAGCGKSQNNKRPIIIWHVYGGQADSQLNSLMSSLIGRKKKEGIKIQVGMVSK